MSRRTVAVIRQFLCPACKHSRKEFLRECDSGPICCDRPMEAMVEGRPAKTAIFPFVTTHVDGHGTPIQIDSLHHLRKIEKHFGVCFTGFNNHTHNLDTPRDLPRHRPGGREYEG